MNSRRLVRLLQAVSYDIPDCGHSVPARDICENRISIEEAIALYLQTAAQIVTPPVRQPVRRDTAQHSQPDDAQVQEPGYLIVMEANRIESRCRRDAREQIAFRNQRRKRQGRAGATSRSLPVDDGWQQANAYDRLDVNRTEGYLLYSYDKQGTHSILGRDIRPGGYGDRITDGEYRNKA